MGRMLSCLLGIHPLYLEDFIYGEFTTKSLFSLGKDLGARILLSIIL
jgi:hypothetical protein